MPGDDEPVELRYLSLQCLQLTSEGTNGAMRRTPRYPPSMAAVSGTMPRRAGASTAGVGPLGVRYRTPFTIDSAHLFAIDRNYDRLNANAPDHIMFTWRTDARTWPRLERTS